MGFFDKITRDAGEGAVQSELIHHVSDDELDELLESSDMPVMVDFWAPWCAPCHMITPVLESIARDYDGKALVAKINVDDHQGWASRLGVRGIPTIAIFRGGKPVNQLVGVRSESDLRSALDDHLPTAH